MSGIIVVQGIVPPGPFALMEALSIGGVIYQSYPGSGQSTPTAPPPGSVLTQTGGNKYHNGSKRTNSAAEVARFIQFMDKVKQEALNKINSDTNYFWTDANGNIRVISGEGLKLHLFNISWVFVDADFSKVNGGVGMAQVYGQYDPRVQVTIDLGAAVQYMDDPGGANFLILHELYHGSFGGRGHTPGAEVIYSAAWNAREQRANDFAKAMAGHLGIPITTNFHPKNPGYSH